MVTRRGNALEFWGMIMFTGLWKRLTTDPTLRDRSASLAWFVAGLIAWQFGAWPLWRSIAVITPEAHWFLLTLIAMAIVIRFRARAPFLQLIAASLILTLDLLMGGSLGVLLIFTDSVFSAVRYGRWSRLSIATWVGAGVAVTFGFVLGITRPTDPALLTLVVQLAILVMISTAWGWSVRSEHDRTRERMAAANTMANRELRHQIAHDLHDLVANHIAVAGLHIEAAKLRLDPEEGTVRESLDRAKQGTEAAHSELRSLITLLGALDTLDTQVVFDAAAEVSGLGDLVPQGRRLTWHDDGEILLVQRLKALPPTHAPLMIRVLSELVTNAVKHGDGDITVEVHGDTNIAVTNVERASASVQQGSGIGLAGARRIMERIGGSLTSERTPPGWVASLTVPAYEGPDV